MDEFRQRLQQAIGDAYAIERELGGGGMSRVFVAREVALDRPVVVKVLPPELSAAVSLERFRREIKVAARLQHPHIVPVLASGDADGMLYYTMPLVTGESLRAHLSRGELPVAEALRILREVADALARAHDEGVVHRDLKPENVLLSGEHAQVSDFGVAKALHAASGTEAVTSTGIAMGTPAYMAPEQIAADEHVDGRADIYALGVLAYEMLAGHAPFAGPPAQLFAQHMTVEPPPLAPRRPNAPARLIELVERCLQKRPADRPQTIREILDELRAIEISGGTAVATAAATAARPGLPPSSGGGQRRRITVLAAGGLVLAVLGTAAWFGLRGDRSPVASEAASLAILPFASPSADSALNRLGRDLVVTVSTNLDGVAELRVADPMTVLAQIAPGDAAGTADRSAVAGIVGARSVVHGTLVRTGRLVRADLVVETVDSIGSRVLGRGSVTADSADVAALTDSVTWEVLRLVWRGGDLPTPALADLTTRSIEALRAYLDGERLIVANEWDSAQVAFGRAIRADSTFWMAHWRYNYARGWRLQPADSVSARKIRANIAAFPERDRLTIEASLAESLAVRHFLYTDLAGRFPDSWFVAMRLADHLTHDGPALGTTAEDAMRAWERALELHPRLGPAYSHLATLAVREHDTTRMRTALEFHSRDSTGTGLMDLLPRSGDTFVRAVQSWHSGDTTAAAATLGEIVAQSTNSEVALVTLSLLSHRQPQLLGVLQPRLRERISGSAQSIDATRTRLVDLMATGTRGAWNEIHDSLVSTFSRMIADTPPVEGMVDANGLAEEVLAVAAWTGALEPSVALSHARRRADDMRGPDQRARLAWIEGVVAAAQADRAGIERARAAVRAAAGRLTSDLDEALRGMDLWIAGEHAAAASVLDSLSATRGRRSARRFADEYPSLDVVLRLSAARSTLAVGDTAGALRNLAWFDVWNLSTAALPIDAFSPLAHYERARIAQAQGRTNDARRYYERFLEVYTEPPPGHADMVEHARAQLARLSGTREPGS